MPYIKSEDRPKFQVSIEAVLGTLNDPNDNPYVKGEFFGYFVNRLVRKFLGSPDYVNPAFNSSFFNEGKKKALSNAADSIAALLSRADPISSAGNLNYSISAVYWGLLGEAKAFSAVGYGMRAYLNGIIDKIIDQIQTLNAGNQKDATMAFRRHLVIRGVLDHIQHETYRKSTVPYEEVKEAENGSVWVDGQLTGSTDGNQ